MYLKCILKQLGYVIAPLRAQYGINLQECVLKRIKIV